MSVLQNGVWTQETADATHQSSPNLASFLAYYLPKDKPVFDFGCGNGYYLGQLEKAGFEGLGFEGYQLNNFQCSKVTIADLTKGVRILNPVQNGDIEGKYLKGSVISLEVGEHLPKAAQETFMQTLTQNCSKHLVMSWAEIGQPGLGHINCRDQKEVIADVCARGFRYIEDLTMQVRATIEDNTSWFQRTLLIFERI